MGTFTSGGGRPGLKVSGMTEQKVKRMNINVEVSLHDAFKATTVGKNGLAMKKKGRC